MERRKILEAAAASAAPWPVGARAQGPKHRVGVLALSADYARFEEWRAFADEMARRGYQEGREVEYLHRAPGIQTEPEMSQQLQRSVDELSRMKVALIYVVEGDVALRSVMRFAPPVPIVVDRFYLDPVERGLVASLARPGGNVTGNAVLDGELEHKMIELLLEAAGAQSVVGYLDIEHLRTWPLYPRVLQRRRELGRTLRFTPVVESLERFDELSAALERLQRQGVRAVKFDDPEFFLDRRADVAAAFTARRLAAVSNELAYARAGLLLAFGWDVGDIARRSASYVDRILRGTRPQDLPVEQVTKFRLGVNLATARSLGIKLPRSIVVRAQELVE
ncbi:MAG TPA: ABC transporter substrate-binding protein [Burkholderiaceae bacterium]|nr:ABC transporter substrate-binding protein [Burkholderiaceae bacterium]